MRSWLALKTTAWWAALCAVTGSTSGAWPPERLRSTSIEVSSKLPSALAGPESPLRGFLALAVARRETHDTWMMRRASCAGPEIFAVQGKPGALGQVVAVLKAVYDLDHVYVWHGLSAYWSGMSHEEPGVARYQPRLVFADPTPGLAEIEPSMAWNPSVVSGIGVPSDMGQVYRDMHAYLADAGAAPRLCRPRILGKPMHTLIPRLWRPSMVPGIDMGQVRRETHA